MREALLLLRHDSDSLDMALYHSLSMPKTGYKVLSRTLVNCPLPCLHRLAHPGLFPMGAPAQIFKILIDIQKAFDYRLELNGQNGPRTWDD